MYLVWKKYCGPAGKIPEDFCLENEQAVKLVHISEHVCTYSPLFEVRNLLKRYLKVSLNRPVFYVIIFKF